MIFTASKLITILRRLQARHGNSALVVISVPIASRRFDWSSLPSRMDCDIGAINIGQSKDWRFSTDGPEGLHAQLFPSRGVIEFHLDAVNACRDPLSHGIADTQLVSGAALGGALGLAIGLLSGSPAKIGLIGVAGGAIIGSQTPKAPRKVYLLSRLQSALQRAQFRARNRGAFAPYRFRPRGHQ